MSEAIKVSFVLPVYNAAPFLVQCLESLCHQTLKEIEIILVDDGSTDASMDILRDYEKKDKRIQVYENKMEGVGAAQARNMGLDKAVGEFLLVVDSDDYVHEDLAKHSYEKAVETGADIVMFPVQCFDHKTGAPIADESALRFHNLKGATFFTDKEFRDNLFYLTHPAAWNKLFRRSLIEQYALRFQVVHVLDDVFFTFSAMAMAKSISILPEILLFYRKNNSASQVHHIYRDPLACVTVWTELKAFLEKQGKFEELKATYFKRVYDIVTSYLRGLQKPKDFQMLYRCLQEEKIQALFFSVEGYEDYLTKSEVAYLRKIKETDFYQYFYEEYASTTGLQVGRWQQLALSSLVEKEEKVVLYGAGAVGKAFYVENICEKHCDVVAWVDKNHKTLGFPVTGVEEMKTLTYDKILIAVESVPTANAIAQDLISMGVAEYKIASLALGG